MAKLDGITINVGVEISEETVNRCIQILNMWLSDNPDKTFIVLESTHFETGEVEKTLCIDIYRGNKDGIRQGN